MARLMDGGVWNTVAGQPTDDSEMALALGRSIVERGGYDPAAALEAYRWWMSTGPFDIGNTTRKGLQGEPDPGSQANGSLMRIAPLGIWAAVAEEGVACRWAGLDAALTHPNPVCVAATAVFAESLAYAIRTGERPAQIHAHALATAARMAVPAEVFEALQRAEYCAPDDFQTNMGWVLIAFQNAYYRLLHSSTLEEGVSETVMEGGDTDTNAAICGALLGATHGRESIPPQWRRAILSCHTLEGRHEVRRPRPEGLWPADAPALAEALLAAGRNE
jgi:ADP-ribosylglycohydrolase